MIILLLFNRAGDLSHTTYVYVYIGRTADGHRQCGSGPPPFPTLLPSYIHRPHTLRIHTFPRPGKEGQK